MRSTFLAWLVCATLLPATAMGQEESQPGGQPLLDQAVLAKLGAKSMADLQKVIATCDQALAAGLDEESAGFAKSLLSSTLFDHGSRVAEMVFRPNPPRQWPELRQVALRDLERVLEYDTEHGEAQRLIARLHWLPRGDRARGRKAADAAVRLLADDDQLYAKALVLRARFAEDPTQRLTDYTEAIGRDPRNVDAWRERGIHYLGNGDGGKAVDDFLKLLELAPDDVMALQALATALSSQKKADEALGYVDRAIELRPDSPSGYKLRAQIRANDENPKLALDDLTRALDLEPGDVNSLTMRARLWILSGKSDYAKADVERALDLKPRWPQALLLRSLILANESRYNEAIADLKLLLVSDPSNIDLRLQIAAYYYDDKQASKAVEMCSSVLEDDSDNWIALRLRGDASLLFGKHSEAVADYGASLTARPDDSGILNNLAWVLATSPRDRLRDAPRAIRLANRACEITDFKAPHILSTLAAAHAEAGDFERAIQWSIKSVALAREELESSENGSDDVERLEEQLQQLEQELATYRQNKPWRELLDNAEKVVAALPAVDDLELAALDLQPPSDQEVGEPPAQDDNNEE